VLSTSHPSTITFSTSIGPCCDTTVSNPNRRECLDLQVVVEVGMLKGMLSGNKKIGGEGCRVRGGHVVDVRVHLGASGGSAQREGELEGVETPKQRNPFPVGCESVLCPHNCLLLIPTSINY
jgi:hypothetical protein